MANIIRMASKRLGKYNDLKDYSQLILPKVYAKEYNMLNMREIHPFLLRMSKLSVNIFYSHCTFNLHTFTFVDKITLNQADKLKTSKP